MRIRIIAPVRRDSRLVYDTGHLSGTATVNTALVGTEVLRRVRIHGSRLVASRPWIEFERGRHGRAVNNWKWNATASRRRRSSRSDAIPKSY